ncbi:MAG: hypothetical protein ABFD18_07445 [Syntrophomonas sp.]
MEVWSFEVGQPFGLYVNKSLPMQDQCKLAMNEVGHLMIIIALTDMTRKERDILWSSPIKVRLLEDPKGYILPIFRFGQSDMMVETPFDPTLYDDVRISLMRVNQGISMVAIESTTNIIQALQVSDIPDNLHKKLQTSWLKATQVKGFSLEYKRWIDKLYSQYNVIELWKRGQDYCTLGSNQLDVTKISVIYLL